MKTEVGICNLALSWLGASSITALTDDTPEGILCNQLYATSRDAVLEEVDWSFAMTRTVLTPEAATPAFGYTYQFLLPSTLLRLVTISDTLSKPNENTVEWVQENNRVLCDSSPLYARYITQVTDPSKFSFTFCHAVAARIAADASINLTESRSITDAMWKLYAEKLKVASNDDGRGAGRTQIIKNTDLTRVR